MADYRSPRPRANWAVAPLGIIVALDLAQIVAGIMQVELLNRMAVHAPFTMEEVRANDARFVFIAQARLPVFLCSAITFILWFRRVGENNDAITQVPAGTGSSATVSFFIPFLNLVRPYQIMKSIWEGSGPQGGGRGGSGAIVGYWWAGWIASILLSWISNGLATSAGSDAAALASATQVIVLRHAVDTAAAICAILVVRAVTRRQESTPRDEEAIAEAFD